MNAKELMEILKTLNNDDEIQVCQPNDKRIEILYSIRSVEYDKGNKSLYLNIRRQF
jgi:uncharacterized protein YvpB